MDIKCHVYKYGWRYMCGKSKEVRFFKLQKVFGWQGSYFVNISVLHKISFNKGLTAKLPSSSAVSALPVVGSLPGPRRPSSRVWVGLKLSFDPTMAASCLSFALKLLVIIREINNMAGTWNLAAYEIPQAGAAHPKVLCSWQWVCMVFSLPTMGTPETVFIKFFKHLSHTLKYKVLSSFAQTDRQMP